MSDALLLDVALPSAVAAARVQLRAPPSARTSILAPLGAAALAALAALSTAWVVILGPSELGDGRSAAAVSAVIGARSEPVPLRDLGSL